MARFTYTFAVFALLPWAVLHLLWRARKQPEYLRHWGERFGFFGAVLPGPTIWLHAVSVGETPPCASATQDIASCSRT
jgi:3-deoxy-D-manno-octulosonic-acid transferase